MNKNNKKEVEEYYFKLFLNCLKHDEEIIDFLEDETPDFVMNTNRGLVSVELSRLYNTTLKKNEECFSGIVNKAKTRFDKMYSTNLYVLISFKNNLLKIGKHKHAIIEQIFNRVESIYTQNITTEFNNEYVLKNDMFIHDIYITNKLDFNHWQTFGVYSSEPIDVKYLHKVIDTKNLKIKNYKHNFNEKWLLLVANLGSQSSAYNFDYIEIDNRINNFDKIFIYKYRDDAIIQLK